MGERDASISAISGKESPMSPFAPLMTTRVPLARNFAIAALLGATMLASPLTAVRADPGTSAPIQLAQASEKSPATKEATSANAETVEQRITKLHADLKISPAEEAKWNEVAQAMRENASKMEKLGAEKRTQSPQEKTAIEDLKTYREFAQAHVDGLKNLISAFDSLYSVMPADQQKNADAVFRSFGQAASNN
jgi:protein CpxP